MDIVKSIRIFEQVCKDKSFSKAAENLNLVPSAVSRQINELENWLGVQLINRTTRTLRLTDEGALYLQKMVEISAQVEALKSLTQENSELTGSVKITTPIMLGQHDVPRLLSKFKTQHPAVKLSLTLLNRKVDLVEEGYDLAIRAGQLTDSTLHARAIGEVQFKTVASNDYLKNNAPIDHPDDLQHHDCIINTAISNPRRWSYQTNGVTKVTKIIGGLETNDSLCVRSFAKYGQGIARLPERYVQGAIASGDLTEVLNDFIPEPLPVNIIYPSYRHMNATLRSLIDFLSDSFAQADLSMGNQKDTGYIL